MGRNWRPDYVDGQTRASCSICGVPRRFPDDLSYCSDKLFRCELCMETPTIETDRVLAAFRTQPDEFMRPVGVAAAQDASPSLLAIAAARVETLFAGWTPTYTRNDTFDSVP